MKTHIEVEEKGEKIFLRKSFFGWKVIFPIRIDGKIVWRNMIAGGSWWNLVWVALIVLIILGITYEYSIAVTSLNKCMEQTISCCANNPFVSAGDLGIVADMYGGIHYS